ncbi:MAG: NAD-dependent succinate-semialdehyde dehydrogenase [Deltaproteobacteria bacterium]|nr:NAD-dependent succinate-semialdehyde dehydrogenase [Deltaproteobacteria bacterium]
MNLISINPANGEKIAEYSEFSPEETEARILRAQGAFESWSRLVLADRAKLLVAAKDYLLQNKERFAKLMAVEMGKPIVQGRAEVEKCALVCEYYARHGGEFLSPQPASTEAAKSYAAFEPLGVVLAIMPWNFPFWQVFRFAAPALMAGNAALLKHAANVGGCSLAIEEVFRESGFPADLFQSLMISHGEVPAVIGNPAVRAVTLTGSNRAGEEVAAQAGALLKKTVMELGGSDPFIVLADADLERAVDIGVQSRLNNCGQSCISAKRFIVVEEVRERFEGLFIEAMRRIAPGDPLSEATKLGPMARRDLRDELQRQVEGSVESGAQLRLGGRIPDGPGAYYPPTVLTGVRQGMPVFDEEVFGPVAPLISARDEAHAIELANDTPFGLGAAVFTRDLARGEKIARESLNAGSCFVNAMVKSDPRLPFGGIKASGYGRELSSFGIREFVNIKTVSVTS